MTVVSSRAVDHEEDKKLFRQEDHSHHVWGKMAKNREPNHPYQTIALINQYQLFKIREASIYEKNGISSLF